MHIDVHIGCGIEGPNFLLPLDEYCFCKSV